MITAASDKQKENVSVRNLIQAEEMTVMFAFPSVLLLGRFINE